MAVAVVNLGFFLVDNVALFPYNYVYFNELSREYARPDKFDLDYWGFSLKEAVHKLNAIDTKKEPILYVPSVAHLVTPFAGGHLKSVKTEELGTLDTYYEVLLTRYNRQPGDNCKRIAEVKRELLFAERPLELAVVTECKNASRTGFR
jgi:hypothetical protein